MSSNFFHIVAYEHMNIHTVAYEAYFITFYCQLIFHYVDRPILFIHSSVDGHLGYFHRLGTVNGTAVDIHVLVFVWV